MMSNASHNPKVVGSNPARATTRCVPDIPWDLPGSSTVQQNQRKDPTAGHVEPARLRDEVDATVPEEVTEFFSAARDVS
jgi:hypothetical protein